MKLLEKIEERTLYAVQQAKGNFYTEIVGATAAA